MSKIIRTVGLMAMVLGCAVSLAVPAALAQSNCATYGYLALKQARENQLQKCGGTGPRWSIDLKAHIAWCGTVGPSEWKSELRERAKMLESCKK